MNASANAISEYTRNAVLTASNAKLVVLMYDGAIKFMQQARLHLERKNTAAVGQAISRAFNIISELKMSLDPTAGDGSARPLATQLDNLYSFMLNHLVEANIKRDDARLREVVDLMKTLKEGWDAAVNA